MLARLSRTAPSPLLAAWSTWRAAFALWSALSATWRTETVTSATERVTLTASRVWACAASASSPVMRRSCPGEPEATRRAACRTSPTTEEISSTIRLIASTTLPSTSQLTSPRRVRSPLPISTTVSRNVMMFCCSSSRLRRSSSRSVSVWTSDRSRTMDSLKVTRHLTDLVARRDRHQLGEVAPAHALGHAHERHRPDA